MNFPSFDSLLPSFDFLFASNSHGGDTTFISSFTIFFLIFVLTIFFAAVANGLYFHFVKRRRETERLRRSECVRRHSQVVMWADEKAARKDYVERWLGDEKSAVIVEEEEA